MDGNKKINIEALAQKIQQGDLSAFETLYKEYFSGLCQYAFLLLNDRFLAEETTQDVFLKIWETRQQISSERNSFKGYLYAIAHNLCLNILKKNKAQKNRFAILFQSDEWTQISERYGFDDQIVERIEVEETAALIEQIVEQLPAQCREVFRLSRDEEKTNKEIAQQLGLSENTVRVQLFRAVHKIQDELLSL